MVKPPNPLQNDALKNLSGVIIFSLDTEYRYTAFTDSHYVVMNTIWGGEIEIGHSMLEYIQREDDRNKAKHNFDKALQGETLILEEEYGDAAGHLRSWWENRYSPIFNAEMKIVGLTVFVLDITPRKLIEQALRTSEVNYRSIMDQAADGIFIADQFGRYLDVNKAGYEMLGYTREEILLLNIRDIPTNKSLPLGVEELLEGKTTVREWELARKDGSSVSVEISARMMEDGCLIGLARDITERKREEERIRYLAFVMNKISSAVISTDANLRISHWNKGAEALYGWREEEVLGQFVDEVCGTEFAPGQQESAQQHLMAEKTWRAELKQRHRNGAVIWVDASVTLLEDEQGVFIGGVTINSDITERKLAEEELRRTKESIEQINHSLRRAFEREQIASRTDALTGVFNRRYFFELLEYEFAASQRYERPLSLVMFDVDYLKKINDTYGHQAGDEMLRKATQVVGNELRDSDVLSRYGGDEFVILLSNSDEHDAVKVLKRIHSKIQSTQVFWGEHRLEITISAGIASLHSDMENADQLVTLADQALYAAKNSGRNQMYISPGSGM